jgi:hypothetical protein
MVAPGRRRHRRIALGLILGLPLIASCSTAPLAGSPASGVTVGRQSTSPGQPGAPSISPRAGARSSPAASSSSTTTSSPSPSSSPAQGTPASLPANAIKVRLADVPAKIAAGKVVTFTAVLINSSTVAARDVAPVIQVVGGPCGCVIGSLLRYDGKSHRWNAAVLVSGDGDPHFLSHATGGVSVPPSANVAIRYRLTLSALNPAKSLTVALYAVQLPDARQLDVATVSTQIVQS